MSEKQAPRKISKDDLKDQAKLPDLDKLDTNPEDLRDLVQEILKTIKRRQSPTWEDYAKDVVVGLILALLTFAGTAGWQKMQGPDGLRPPQISAPKLDAPKP